MNVTIPSTFKKSLCCTMMNHFNENGANFQVGNAGIVINKLTYSEQAAIPNKIKRGFGLWKCKESAKTHFQEEEATDQKVHVMKSPVTICKTFDRILTCSSLTYFKDVPNRSKHVSTLSNVNLK